MNRIDAKFAELRRRKKAALIPYITAGDPDFSTTLKVLREVVKGGADLIELGVPFSDPMADGPTIQRASERALRRGATLPRILSLVHEFRRTSDIPIVLFGYYNPFFRYGTGRLARAARESGVDGFLCVDLPPEESREFKASLDREGLNLIFLLAPTSNQERIRQVVRQGSGFIYYVSVTGVTGARKELQEEIKSRVRRVRRASSLPVGVGFGISSPEQAAWVASFADAVVVGSALINVMERSRTQAERIRRAGNFVGSLKSAINRVLKK